MNGETEVSLAKVTKRAIDAFAAALLLLLLSPVYLACALAIWLRMGRPIVFRQTRPGYGERLFTALKFRTMLAPDPARGLITDEERLTGLGKFFRATSLDELPEFWNVLKGDMSLVGPRPLLPEYLARYNAHQRRRHEVKPGITGWAQVNGRNALSWAERFELDVWYVDHCSIWLDVKILAITLWKVLRREGISQAGHATMPEFLGTRESTEIRSTRSST
ncbi:MAG: sugar transferase [Candidatus Solibacter sp.]|jgi:lipopolysaccharide/colanic/teichoic acid biosynthesis glycosyltransferase